MGFLFRVQDQNCGSFGVNAGSRRFIVKTQEILEISDSGESPAAPAALGTKKGNPTIFARLSETLKILEIPSVKRPLFRRIFSICFMQCRLSELLQVSVLRSKRQANHSVCMPCARAQKDLATLVLLDEKTPSVMTPFFRSQGVGSVSREGKWRVYGGRGGGPGPGADKGTCKLLQQPPLNKLPLIRPPSERFLKEDAGEQSLLCYARRASSRHATV